MRRLLIVVAAASIGLAGCSSGSGGEVAGTSPGQASQVSTIAAPLDTTASTTPPPSTTAPSTAISPPAAIVVTSSAYREGERIPVEFTCEGEGTQPPYTVSGLPSGTMSLAFVMDSSGEAAGSREAPHWVQFDIPPESQIPEDALS